MSLSKQIEETHSSPYQKLTFEEALYRMISKHDANFGITWGTVDYYLNEYCTK
jgi:hypothetical protein